MMKYWRDEKRILLFPEYLAKPILQGMGVYPCFALMLPGSIRTYEHTWHGKRSQRGSGLVHYPPAIPDSRCVLKLLYFQLGSSKHTPCLHLQLCIPIPAGPSGKECNSWRAMQFRSGLFCSLLAAAARPAPEQLGPPFGSMCAQTAAAYVNLKLETNGSSFFDKGRFITYEN
jgi:hypothetical protein